MIPGAQLEFLPHFTFAPPTSSANRHLRQIDINPAGLAIAPFVLMLFFVGGNEAEILRYAQNDRARCPIGSGLKGKGEKL